MIVGDWEKINNRTIEEAIDTKPLSGYNKDVIIFLINRAVQSKASDEGTFGFLLPGWHYKAL